MADQTYAGTELELFGWALNWKRYVASFLTDVVCGAVLEVGAGLGANTSLLYEEHIERWVCVEPDPVLRATASRMLQQNPRLRCEVRGGTLFDLPHHERFDCILYLDVLEHIKRDAEELMRAAEHLREQGYIVILSPAHQWLYSAFDQAIGHFRRYDRSSLLSLTPAGVVVEKVVYLDCMGVLASLANKIFLKRSTPSSSNLLLWDRLLVPLSRLCDPILSYSLGKSILLLLRKGS